MESNETIVYPNWEQNSFEFDLMQRNKRVLQHAICLEKD
jgi:hypothetical protein